MQYLDMREYITFLFSMLDEFSATQEAVCKRGRPQTYADVSLIVFYAVMTLKGITAMRTQQTYLFHHPLMLERCQLPACPFHVTLRRRYKAKLRWRIMQHLCEVLKSDEVDSLGSSVVRYCVRSGPSSTIYRSGIKPLTFANTALSMDRRCFNCLLGRPRPLSPRTFAVGEL